MSTNPRIRPALGFANAADSSIEILAGAVHAGLDGNPHYPNPPMDLEAFKAVINSFAESIVAASDGSRTAAAEKDKQRQVLVEILRQLGHYVEGSCKGDMAVFLSSGFEAISTSRTKQPVAQPHILHVRNGNSGQLLVKVLPIRNAYGYEVRYAAGASGGTCGPWATAAFTSSRCMPISGLTPGTVYSFQVRALGSLGYSDWSDFASRMCI